MALEPWYKVVLPRREVREGRSFNPDEFAIALEQVVVGTAPADYRDPEAFFERTCFTRALRDQTGMVLRRLAGETANTAPVMTLVTQFGGGKTHTLTALYHLVTASDRERGLRDRVEQWLAWKRVSSEVAAGALGSELDATDRAEIRRGYGRTTRTGVVPGARRVGRGDLRFRRSTTHQGPSRSTEDSTSTGAGDDHRTGPRCGRLVRRVHGHEAGAGNLTRTTAARTASLTGH